MTKKFKLENQEYIQLNDLLKVLNIVSTGGEAKIVILEGEVMVNGEVEFQVRKKLRKGDKIEIGDIEIGIIK